MATTKTAVPGPRKTTSAAAETKPQRQIRIPLSPIPEATLPSKVSIKRTAGAKPTIGSLDPVNQEDARISPEHRQSMIREAAYFHAERRGFLGGDPMQDWMEAEVEIDRMLDAGALPSKNPD